MSDFCDLSILIANLLSVLSNFTQYKQLYERGQQRYVLHEQIVIELF